MAAEQKVLVRCGHCDGTGKKEAPELSRTLRAVHAAQWRSTQFIARVLMIKETATSNRLADLLKLELVERRGSGARYSPYEWRKRQ